MSVRFPEYDGRTICMVQVPASAEPVFVQELPGPKRTFYLRVGNRTESLDVAEMHRYSRQRFRQDVGR